MSDFLEWQSKLTLEEVFASHESIAYPSFCDAGYLYLTTLPDQKSRSVLTRYCNGEFSCITPSPYSLRTKINEYGGKPYWQFYGGLVFANQSDQCLYRQYFTVSTDEDTSLKKYGIAKPERITSLPDSQYTYMYSDVHHLSGDLFIAVIELNDRQKNVAENTCFIGLVDAGRPDSAPTVLISGADFYSNLVHCNNNIESRIAWVQWNHPMMPWDENQIMTAQLSSELTVGVTEAVITSKINKGASHCQLAFDCDGNLLFSVDFSDTTGRDDYWNIYAWNQNDKIARPLTQEIREFGYPHWQYGDLRIVNIGGGRLLTVGSDAHGDALFLVNIREPSCSKVFDKHSTIQCLASNGAGAVLALETDAGDRQRLVKFDCKGDSLYREVLKAPLAYPYPVSSATPVSYSCRDGGRAHGYYYSPVNHNSNGVVSNIGLVNERLVNEAPPLIIMVHGGPTARAYGHFDIQKQFWCSNGFAVFDVNHRGSNGYGRRYRDALYGVWGELDTSDIVDGIDYLVKQGLADPNQVCIRGKSAGGYAVLRALTEYPEVFRAGACYYGIGNLATLAEVTHKFEKHYTDRLIAEPYDRSTATEFTSHYYSRSPINKVDQIASAMIVFQGSEDKVVPPSVAHEIVEKLTANNIAHEYVEYPDEGHGFRQVDNNIDSWSRELSFYRKNLKPVSDD